MKKRIAFRRVSAFFMAVVMMASMMPSSVFAAPFADNGEDNDVQIIETDELFDETDIIAQEEISAEQNEIVNDDADVSETEEPAEEQTEETPAMNEEIPEIEEAGSESESEEPVEIEDIDIESEMVSFEAMGGTLEAGTKQQTEPIILAADTDMCPEGYGWAWDADTKTLYLNKADFNIQKPEGEGEQPIAAINFPVGENTVVIEGNSTIESKINVFKIDENSRLTIKGDKKLDINIHAGTPAEPYEETADILRGTGWNIYHITITDKADVKISSDSEVFSNDYIDLSVTDEAALEIESQTNAVVSSDTTITLDNATFTAQSNVTETWNATVYIGKLYATDSTVTIETASGKALSSGELNLSNTELNANGNIYVGSNTYISDESEISCVGPTGINEYNPTFALNLVGKALISGESKVNVKGEGVNGNLLKVDGKVSIKGNSTVTLDADESNFFGIYIDDYDYLYVSEGSTINIRTANKAIYSNGSGGIDISGGARLNVVETKADIEVFTNCFNFNVDNAYVSVDVPDNNTAWVFGPLDSNNPYFPLITLKNAYISSPEGLKIGESKEYNPEDWYGNNDCKTVIDANGDKITCDFTISPDSTKTQLYIVSNPKSSFEGNEGSDFYISANVGILNPGSFTTEDITYQWYKEASGNDIAVSGATDKSFKIPTTIGKNRYFCVASLDMGSDTLKVKSSVCEVNISPLDKSRVMTDVLDLTKMTSNAEDAEKGWKWDYDNKKLTLNNIYMDITSTDNPIRLYSGDKKDITVEVIGDCYINCSNSYNAIYEEYNNYFSNDVERTINFIGDGTLNINAQSYGIYAYYSEVNMDVKCNIYAKQYGLYVGREFTINKEINIYSGQYGIYQSSSSNGDKLSLINGKCNITINERNGQSNGYNICAYSDLEINNDCYFKNDTEGGYALYHSSNDSLLTINDAAITLDVLEGYGLYSKEWHLSNSTVKGSVMHYLLYGGSGQKPSTMTDSEINAVVYKEYGLYSSTGIDINNSKIKIEGQKTYNNNDGLVYSSKELNIKDSEIDISGFGSTLFCSYGGVNIDNSTVNAVCSGYRVAYLGSESSAFVIGNNSKVHFESSVKDAVNFNGKVQILESTLEIKADGRLGSIPQIETEGSKVVSTDKQLHSFYDEKQYIYILMDSDNNEVQNELIIEPSTDAYVVEYGIDLYEGGILSDDDFVHEGKVSTLKVKYNVKNTTAKPTFNWFKYDFDSDTFVPVTSSVKGYNTDTLTVPSNVKGQQQYKCRITLSGGGTTETEIGSVTVIPANREPVKSSMQIDRWTNSDDSHWDTEGWKWDADTKTFTVSEFYYAPEKVNSNSTYLYFSIDGLKIEVADGSYNLIRTDEYGIYATDNVTIQGDGTLWINGGYGPKAFGQSSVGIYTNNGLTVKRGVRLYAIAGAPEQIYSQYRYANAIYISNSRGEFVSESAFVRCRTYDMTDGAVHAPSDINLHYCELKKPDALYYNSNDWHFYTDEAKTNRATDIYIDEIKGPYAAIDEEGVDFKNIGSMTPVKITCENRNFSSKTKAEYKWYSVEDFNKTNPVLVSMDEKFVPKAELGEKLYYLSVTITDNGKVARVCESDVVRVFVLPDGRQPASGLLINSYSPSMDYMSTYGYKYDADKKKLTLDNAVFYSSNSTGNVSLLPGITVEVTEGSVNYICLGENVSATGAIVINGTASSNEEDLFTGNGKLYVESSSLTSGIYCISEKNLRFTGGIDVNVRLFKPGNSTYALRFKAYDMVLDNANLTVTLPETRAEGSIYSEKSNAKLTIQNNSNLVCRSKSSLLSNSTTMINVDPTSSLSVSSTEAEALQCAGLTNSGAVTVKSFGGYRGIVANWIINDGVIDVTSENANAIRIKQYFINHICSTINAVNNPVEEKPEGDAATVKIECGVLKNSSYARFDGNADINNKGSGYPLILNYTANDTNYGFGNMVEPEQNEFSFIRDTNWFRVPCYNGTESTPVKRLRIEPKKDAISTLTVNGRPAYASDDVSRNYTFTLDYSERDALIFVTTWDENDSVYFNGSSEPSTTYMIGEVSDGQFVSIKTVDGEGTETNYTLTILKPKKTVTVRLLNETSFATLKYGVGTDTMSKLVYNSSSTGVNLPNSIVISATSTYGYKLWAVKYNGEYVEVDEEGKATFPITGAEEFAIDDNCFVPDKLFDPSVSWDTSTSDATAIVNWSGFTTVTNAGQYRYYYNNANNSYFELNVYDVETGEQQFSESTHLRSGSMKVTGLDSDRSYRFVFSRVPYSREYLAYPTNVPEYVIESCYGVAILEPREEIDSLKLTDAETNSETTYYSVELGSYDRIIKTNLPLINSVLDTISFTYINADDENTIAKLTNKKDGTISIQGIGVGTTYVVVDAKMYGKNIPVQIRIDVFDPDEEVLAPQLSLLSNTATVNIYSTYDTDYASAPTVRLGYVGDSADRFESAEFENETLNTFFELVKVDDRTFKIQPNHEYDFSSAENAAAIKAIKSSYKTNILVKTTKGTELRTAGVFTLKVTKKLPTVKATAVKLNSFYENPSAPIQFTCKEGQVVSAIVDESKTTAKVQACPAWLNYDEDTMSVSVDGVNVKYSGKLYLKVFVAGYNTPVAINLSVSAAKTALKVKLAQNTITVPALYIDAGEQYVLNVASNDKKIPYTDFDITSVAIAEQSNLDVMSASNKKTYANSVYYQIESFNTETGEIRLSAKETVVSEKDGKIPTGKVMLYATVGDNDKQIIELPFTVKTAAKDSAKLSKTSLTLDITKGFDANNIGNDAVQTVVVPGVNGMKVGNYLSYNNPDNSLDVVIKNSANKVVLGEVLDVQYDSATRTFTFRANENTDYKAGSYKVLITTVRGVKLTVTVKLNCKIPSYKLSASKVILNKKISNDAATVTITPSTAALTECTFSVTDSKGKALENGIIGVTKSSDGKQFTIKLQEDAAYNTNYKVLVKYNLKDYPAVVTKPLTITVNVPAENKSVPSVKIKTTGFVDLYRPESTGVVVTPTFTNVNKNAVDDSKTVLKVTAYKGRVFAQSEYIEEDGDVSDWFKYEDGKIVLDTTSDAYLNDAIDLANTYKFTLTYKNGMDSGEVYVTPVTTLQVKGNKVTVTQSKKEVKLNKLDRHDREYVTFTVADKNVSDIEEVKIYTAKGKTCNYEIVKICEGVYAIGFNNREVAAGIKTNTIKIEIWFDGIDSSVSKAATSVNLKVVH